MDSDNEARTRLITHFWTQAQPVVSAYIVSVIINFHDADDIIGQVAETIVTKFNDYDKTRPFTPWALGIARQRVLQYFDRRSLEKHQFFDHETLQALECAYEAVTDEVSPRLTALRACLQNVQGKSRKVLELRYVDGLQAEEIAGRMSMSSNAVWVMLHRLRQSLAACIEGKLPAQRGAL